MRILFLNWRDPQHPAAGGAEKVTLRHAEALAGRGHQVTWFSPQRRIEPWDALPLKMWPLAPQREELFTANAKIKIVRGGLGQVRSRIEAMKFCASEPQNLIVDQHHGVPWFVPFWTSTRCVAYIHEVLGPVWRHVYSWPKAVFGAWQERRIIKLYRKVPFWCPSLSTWRELVRLGVKKVFSLQNGCDVKVLEQLEPRHIGVDDWRLVVVSRLVPAKRIEDAIFALRLLRNFKRHSTLSIIGNGQCADSLQQLTRRMGLENHVRFVFHADDQMRDHIVGKAHFLLHTSVREGWGLNVIEANALGVPAAVYPVAGLVDSVQPGLNGVIARDESPMSLVAAMLSCEKSYESMRWFSLGKAKHYSWDWILPALCEWIEKQ